MGCGLQWNLRSRDRQPVGWVLISIVSAHRPVDYVRVEWVHRLRHGAGSNNHTRTGDIPAADSSPGGDWFPDTFWNGSNTVAQPRTSNESAPSNGADRVRPKSVRLHPGMVFGIIPESCSASARNRVRLQPGMVFGLPRNTHLPPRFWCCSHLVCCRGT